MIETIKIKSNKHPQGWVLINKEDFNPEVHEAWVDPIKLLEEDAGMGTEDSDEV